MSTIIINTLNASNQEIQNALAKAAQDHPVATKKKRQSGKRNADTLFRAWLRRSKIPVEGEFVMDWIEEALERAKMLDHGGIARLADALGITERTLMDAKNGKVRPMLHWFERLAEAMGRQQELEEMLPEPGIDGWGDDDTRYCGHNHPGLNVPGCGTHFHPHHEDGLCKECFEGQGDPDFVPRDVRMAKEE